MTTPKLTARPRHRQHVRKRPKSIRTPSATATTAIIISSFLNFPQHTLLFASAACPNPCENKASGFIQIPETNCGEFAQCNAGDVSQKFSCQSGLIYDASMQQCNWAYSATCGPDPECLTETPTEMPTPSPTKEPTKEPTAKPTMRPVNDGGGGGGDESMDSRPSLGGTSPSPPSPSTSTESSPSFSFPSPPGPTPTSPTPAGPTSPTPAAAAPVDVETIPSDLPIILPPPLRTPHHTAVWAHLNANKIKISNQLLHKAHKLQNILDVNINADELRNYAYTDFYRALRSMSEEGYALPSIVGEDGDGHALLARSVFYLGPDPTDFSDSVVVGLVNVAAFLSQALADSLSSGSCDEINVELVNGLLPASNACGQYGQSYQDMKCAKEEEEFMACNPYDAGVTMAGNNGRESNVQPLYCGDTETYPFTGEASVVLGRGVVEGEVPNANDRTDVDGCCWWGRGTINTRGICQYGKLNYYLGARAALEGRPARYPTIDFCTNPQSICSKDWYQSSTSQTNGSSQLEWITGLFQWIDSVQSYDYYDEDNIESNNWNYINKLNAFVAGGMVDGTFLQGVSAIVTQGCHEVPCLSMEGTEVEMTDGAERWGYFLQVLEAFGLPVKGLRES